MILESEHVHTEQLGTTPTVRLGKSSFNSSQQTKKCLQQILEKSCSRLNECSVETMRNKRQLCQKRVYASLNISKLEYLFILFQERRNNIKLQADLIENILLAKNEHVTKDLIKDRLSIQRHNNHNQSIPQQTKQTNLKNSLASSEVVLSSPNQDQQWDQYQQFRKQAYWKHPSNKAEQIQEFIQHMKEEQKGRHQRNKQRLKQQLVKKRDKEQSRVSRQEQEQKKLKQQLVGQFQKRKQQQIKEEGEKRKRLEEVSSFLGKFKQKPPNYIIFSQRYKRKESEFEKERSQFLKQLKQAKRHCSLGQLREEMRRHQKLRQIHSVDRQQERKMQESLQNQISCRQKKLYRSKLHTNSRREQSPRQDVQAEKQKQMLRMIMYSKKAQSEHGPKVDSQKRQEINRQIEASNKRRDKSWIFKVVNGQEVAINRAQLSPRKIGLGYLQEVKEITSQIERKPPPTPEVIEQKIIDRSLMKNTFYNRKITISNWKDIMGNKELTPEEKEEKLKVYFDMVKEKKLQSKHQFKKSGLQRSLEIQNMTDHYEIQTLDAKLALLKSFK